MHTNQGKVKHIHLIKQLISNLEKARIIKQTVHHNSNMYTCMCMCTSPTTYTELVYMHTCTYKTKKPLMYMYITHSSTHTVVVEVVVELTADACKSECREKEGCEVGRLTCWEEV